MIKTVGVVGAGTMGSGIAQVFAQAGMSVQLVDVAQPMLDAAKRNVDKSLGKLVEKGKLPAATREAALARLSTTTSIDLLSDADFIVEAIVENADAKQALFKSLDVIARDAFHESRSLDAARRTDSWPGHLARVDAQGVGTLHDAGKDGGRSGGLSWLHCQSHSDADDQRGDLRRDGGCGHP